MPQRWIGKINDFALCAWPARFPDLTECDFFLRWYVKDKVCIPPLSANINDIKDQVKAAIKTVHLDMLRRVREGFSNWLSVVWWWPH